MVKLVFEAENFKELTDMMLGVEETKKEQEKAPETEEEFDPYSERVEVKIYDSVCWEDKLIRTKMWLDTHHIPYVVDDKRCSTLKVVTRLNWEEISKLYNAIYQDRDDSRAILL